MTKCDKCKTDRDVLTYLYPPLCRSCKRRKDDDESAFNSYTPTIFPDFSGGFDGGSSSGGSDAGGDFGGFGGGDFGGGGAGR